MKLTLRQQEVLNLLIDYQRKHGFPPTTYELTGMLGCRSPNAAATHLKALVRKGAITITRGVSRGISITPSVSRKELVVNLNSIVKVKLNEVSLSHLENNTKRTVYVIRGYSASLYRWRQTKMATRQ